MKNVLYALVLLPFLGFSSLIFSQNIIVNNITHNSAKIIFSNPNNELKNIHIFTKSSEDTLIFKEDFSKLPRIPILVKLGGYLYPSYIPLSYTEYPGCMAQNISSIPDLNPSNQVDFCYLVQTGGGPSSSFTSPNLDLNKSNNRFRIRFKNFYVNKSTSDTLSILISYQNGVFNKIASIPTSKSGMKFFDSTFNIGQINSKIRFQLGVSKKVTTTIIDDIIITYPSIIRDYLQNSPYTSSGDSINVYNLISNTKYYIFIEGESDTISFNIISTIRQDEVSNLNANNVSINYSSSSNPPKLILNQISNPNTVIAKDLFISKYINTNLDKAIEIYNGTREDICLSNYSLRLKKNTQIGHSGMETLDFNQEDSILSGKTIIVSFPQISLDTSINTVNHIYYKFYQSANVPFYGGNSIALLKNNIPVDIFGDTTKTFCEYWEDLNNSFKTSSTIIKRKSNVNKGRIINPTTASGANSMSNFLSSEWDLVYSGSSPSYANLSGVGIHNMDNAYGTWDSLIGIYSLNDGLIDLGNGNYSYPITGLEEDTYYETCLMVIEGGDSIYSNKKTFKTGVNTIRTSTGNWNDNNWTKGEPSEKDNVVVPVNQTLTIPDGINAKAYSIFLKDSLGQSKSELINKGSLEIKNSVVEVDFKGYNNNADGWYLFGLPINPISFPQDSIENMFFNLGNNDDLYYWQENYTDSANLGRWINYKAIPKETGDFFIRERGYLVSYSQHKKLVFNGSINDSNSYNLLNNASLNSPIIERGWHLCSNPYPFSLKINNINRTNASNPSLLDTESLNYIALDPTNPSSYKIPPFTGFFVQVSNPNNNLSISKNTNGTKTLLKPSNSIEIKLTSCLGIDKTKILIIKGTSQDYDVDYDNRKIQGLGDVSEISTIFNNQAYALNAIDDFKDSLVVDLEILVKENGYNSIQLDIMDNKEFKSIILVDKSNNKPILDFLIDSIYTGNFSIGRYNNYQIIFNKLLSSIKTPSLNQNNLKIIQNKETLNVIIDEKILSLELLNPKAQTIAKKKNSNWITIPEKGVYIIKIITQNNQYHKKIICL